MSQLPRYESYKDSGVQWLGEIPSHWDVKRMKFLLSEKLKYGANESAEFEDKDQPRYIRITDINDSGTLREDTFKSLEIEKAQEYLLDDLDILLARSGATVGKSYLHKKDKVNVACYAGYLIRARFNKENYDPKFINLFLQSKAYWSWIESVNIQATIQNVSAEKYNDLALSIPSLAEQKIIVDFLDKRLAQVDALIAKQETLLEKLAEQRVALISHAVTKGLNPDVEMKESGVTWLGKVPKNWGIANLRYFISCNSGDALESSRILRDADEFNNIPVIGGNGLLGFTENSNYKNECIAVGRVGALCGNVHFINYESWINDNALLIKLISDKFNINYLIYLLRSRNLNELASKTAQPLLTGTQVKAEKVCIPLIKEQLEIVRYLDTNLESLDKLLETVNKTIQTLREYRSTLITQVVTGKIDVRNLKLN